MYWVFYWNQCHLGASFINETPYQMTSLEQKALHALCHDRCSHIARLFQPKLHHKCICLLEYMHVCAYAAQPQPEWVLTFFRRVTHNNLCPHIDTHSITLWDWGQIWAEKRKYHQSINGIQQRQTYLWECSDRAADLLRQSPCRSSGRSLVCMGVWEAGLPCSPEE